MMNKIEEREYGHWQAVAAVCLYSSVRCLYLGTSLMHVLD